MSRRESGQLRTDVVPVRNERTNTMKAKSAKKPAKKAAKKTAKKRK